VKPVYVKPAHVEPVYIEPVKYCFFKVFYKQPCWDYQKELTFNNLGEAKQMAQMVYDNGFRVALTKYEGLTYDKVGYDKIGGPIGGGKNFDEGKAQVLFQGEGKLAKTQGPQGGNLESNPLLLGKPQLLDSPILLDGAE
jgi:hypothetical protein